MAPPESATSYPSISVAMCTYNGERYLREQLESIAAQSLRPTEIVICDDGSDDSTLSIAGEFARAVDFDVKIVRNDVNLGVAKNFEKAIGQCGGELIALADQDDLWYPNKLERLSARMAENLSAGGVFSDADLIDESSQPTGECLWKIFHFGSHEQRLVDRGEAARLLCVLNFVTGSTMIFRASLRPSLLPVGAAWIHDGWFAWMLVLYSRLDYLPERLMAYRVHSAQKCGVGARGFRQRLANLRRSWSELHADKAERFEALEARCAERGGCSEQTMKEVRQVVEFSRMRANLPRSAVSRATHVLPKILWYRRYSRWMPAMVRDIVRG